jgi:hypothetical protein
MAHASPAFAKSTDGQGCLDYFYKIAKMVGVWPNWLWRTLRVREVLGSSPSTPTIFTMVRAASTVVPHQRNAGGRFWVQVPVPRQKKKTAQAVFFFLSEYSEQLPGLALGLERRADVLPGTGEPGWSNPNTSTVFRQDIIFWQALADFIAKTPVKFVDHSACFVL